MNNARDLLRLVESEENDYSGYGPWEKFIPGRGRYDRETSDWISFDGNVTLPNGEKVGHVAEWNEFDEGELIHVVVKFRDQLFRLDIVNDSWNDGGIEFSRIVPVKAVEVTKVEYQEVKE